MTISTSRALSLTQPWASLCLLPQPTGAGEKMFETRSWPTKVFGPIWIHASKGFPKQAKELCAAPIFAAALARHGYTSWQDLPTGQLLGTVDLIACQRTEDVLPSIAANEIAFGNWNAGRWCFRLAFPSMLKTPMPCKGALSFWQVPADVLQAAAAVGFKERLPL